MRFLPPHSVGALQGFSPVEQVEQKMDTTLVGGGVGVPQLYEKVTPLGPQNEYTWKQSNDYAPQQ